MRRLNPTDLKRNLAAVFSVALISVTANTQVVSRAALPNAPSSVKRLEILLLSDSPERLTWQDQTQTTSSSHWSLGAAVKRGARDQKEIYSAPFRRKNLKWDLLFIAVTGGLIAGDRHVTGAISHDNLSLSRNISDVGVYSTVATTGVLLVSGLMRKDQRALETGILGFESLANTVAVGSVIDLVAGRERPLEGEGKGRFWVNHILGSSFPSMHSGVTWSLASVIGHEYPNNWVRFLVYGTATTVSATRVTGLKHFPSDVEVGGVLGFFIGRHLICAHSRFLHSHCEKKIQKSQTGAPAAPTRYFTATVSALPVLSITFVGRAQLSDIQEAG
jgi:membrane-associated phospholipid phosphatase